MIEPWEWNCNDKILHTLPLHHIHGIVNALTCALWSGATVEMMHFNALNIWERFIKILENKKNSLTLFMGVPTMYGTIKS